MAAPTPSAPLMAYRDQPFGPLEIVRTPERISAVAPDGATVEIEAPAGDRAAIRDLLAPGLPVLLDGAPIATLRQTSHGWRPSTRTIGLEPAAGAGLPSDAFFRVRGLITNHMTLEATHQVLISVPRPHALNRIRRLVVADGVPDRMVLIYAAVADRLLPAVRI
ncbi:MAG: hypothetical protein QNJ12_15090 [Ilumatobacter sp.]|uniref:hypothetical protein n=1 Tax=Ilumatobacter sp. TaxID=1967498 RepID=UPI00262D1122|nr:hypothetical protein [Ilumatobacter sp.]MDJ0770125.1 hypothetical protein [Ilumatobacter sp.]